jgi:hypothetical protein
MSRQKILIGACIILFLILHTLICFTDIYAKGNRQDDPSYQVDHNRTKNFTPTQHYLQEEIDRVSDIFNGINYHEFIINEDLGDVTSKLIFGRTTGGNVEISYQGTQISTNKIFNPNGNTYGDPGTYPNKIVLWQDAENDYFGFGVSTGDLDYFSQSNHRWYVGYNGRPGFEAMALNASGQLLINTTSASGSEKLRVNGNQYLDGELQVSSTGKIISGSKALTDGSATGLFEVAIPSNTSVGGTVHYSIKCFDGTDLQNHSGTISFAGVNKAGTVTSDIDEVYLAASETQVATAGTLSNAWTITNGAGKITINLNANTSLTPTSFIINYTIMLNGDETITLL